MRIAFGRMPGPFPGCAFNLGDAPAALAKSGIKTRLCHHPPPSRAPLLQKGALLFPWCSLEGARQHPNRDFRESQLWHFGLCTGVSFRKAGKRGHRRTHRVAILLTQSTSAVINKPHLSIPCSRVPAALFKSQFPCFAQLLHTVATHKVHPTEPLTSPQNDEYICFTPLHKAMGSHQDLLQHSQVTMTSVLSPRRAGYPQQPSCSPRTAEQPRQQHRTTTSLCFSLIHQVYTCQTILRISLLENTNSGTSR